MNERQIEQLRISSRRFGQIHPVIEDADGNVLSGEHRLAADPAWRRERREDIKDPLDKIAFKFAANIQRQPTPKEKQQLIKAAFLHWTRRNSNVPPTMRQLADTLGLPVSTIETFGKGLFNSRPAGILRLPNGTSLTSPRTRGEARETTLEHITAVPLTVQGSSGNLAIHLPKALTLKYELSDGTELIASCKRDRFVVRKRQSW